MDPQEGPTHDGGKDADRPLRSGSRWEPGAADDEPATPTAATPAPVAEDVPEPASDSRRPRRRALPVIVATVGLAAVLGIGALVGGYALDDGPDAGPAGTTGQHHHHDGDHDGDRNGDRNGEGPSAPAGAPGAPAGVAT